MLFTLRLQLAQVKDPPVWRRLTVPAEFSFERFHRVIQAAFGWQDAHLWLFSFGESLSSSRISIPHPMDAEEDITVYDARRRKLKDIFPGYKRYHYIYDYGDYWVHQIRLEDFNMKTEKHATLLGGKGACPPEDCGGPGGYEDLKAVMADPRHPEYEEMRVWLGLGDNEDWNAGYFDAPSTSAAVGII